MSTTQMAATLFQLQQIDLELDRLTNEHQALTSSLQGNAKLRKLRSDYEIAQEEWQSSLQTQKDAEWTLEDLNNRLQHQEQRLYNGSVTNPKELQSLQQEVQRLRAQQNRQEERLLEVIDATESLQETAQQKQAVLQQAQEAWQEEFATLTARGKQVEEQQRVLREKREQTVASLDVDLVKRYEAMRRTKQGRAVSKVEQNSCQWCRVILTPSELQHVRISSELQTCTNCGRILYYDRQA
ncbi:MAG TPA: C4-type zinc ribbon domain-containing protein [Ktedonobacteraceae bacterium]